MNAPDERWCQNSFHKNYYYYYYYYYYYCREDQGLRGVHPIQ